MFYMAVESMSSSREEDISVLHHVPFADVIYNDLFKLGNNYEVIEVFERIPQCAMDESIINWGLEKDGHCLLFVPEDKITDTMIEKAFKKSGLDVIVSGRFDCKPEYIIEAITNRESEFCRIPKELLTARHCLLQETLYPEFFKLNPERLPEEIKNGQNVYTLSRALNQLSKEQSSYGEVVELYEGQSVRKGNEVFKYDKEKGELKQTVIKPTKTCKIKR